MSNYDTLRSKLGAALAAPQLQPAPQEEPLPEPPKPTASEGQHPLAISSEEGAPLVTQPELLKHLQKLLELKYTAMILYTNYGDRIRSPYRDSIYGHFKEHMKEERSGAYDFAMKITALGGEPTPKIHKIPDVSGVGQIFMAIMQAEKELIEAAREAIEVCGEYVGLRLLLEENLLNDQRHLDDARRMYATQE